MKLIEWEVSKNQDEKPVLLLTLEVPLVVDEYATPDDLRWAIHDLIFNKAKRHDIHSDRSSS